MRLRCVALEPTLPQAKRLGRFFRAGQQEFPVSVGSTYIAYGLRQWGAGSWVDIEAPAGYLVVVPLCLFEIEDGSVSRHWILQRDVDGDFALLPPEMHARYFLDDLSSGDPGAAKAFAAVKARMY